MLRQSEDKVRSIGESVYLRAVFKLDRAREFGGPAAGVSASGHGWTLRETSKSYHVTLRQEARIIEKSWEG